MKKILITGAGGFVGSRILQQWQGKYELCALPKGFFCTADEALTRAQVEALHPDVILHTAALSDTSYCAQHPAEAYRANVELPVWLARAAQQTKAKLVAFSSDQVYAGVQQQGACKLTLNVKEGIIQEALVETIGCSGMTHSAAMAAEILPGLTVMEALNTDLVCDAINTAMRELFLQIVYGRTQSAFSDDGLAVGAGLEDLGKGLRSQVGTMYATKEKGVRYLEMAEGYVTGIALDENNEVIGYQFVSLGKMTDFIKKGDDPNTAWEKAKGQYGRVDDAVKIIDPRQE